MIAALMISSALSVMPVAARSDEDVGEWIEWARVAWDYFEPGIGFDFLDF